MNLFYKVCLSSLIAWMSKPEFSKASDIDLDKNCQILYTIGYGYRHFFHLPTSSFVKNGSIIVDFFVMAKSDAHILLSSNSAPQDTDAVYEIVIGAGRNSFSDIRRLRRAATRATTSTKNILSDKTMRNFQISIERGKIKVTEKGSQVPFLNWQDTNPIDVKFISFCTWTGVSGKWAYDCKGGESQLELVEEEKNKSNMIRLHENLINAYNYDRLPVMDDEVININASIQLSYINLDAKMSVMTTKGILELMYFDPQMKWDPQSYGNITGFTGFPLGWDPDFLLLNAVDVGAFPLKLHMNTVKSEGLITAFRVLNFETRCALDLSLWPWDEHSCQVKLGVSNLHNFIDINLSESSNEFFPSAVNEWEIISLVAETRSIKTPWEIGFDSEGETDFRNDRKTVLVLEIKLKRRTNSFYMLFLLPVFVIMVITLITFWLPPTFERLWLLSVAQISLLIFTLATYSNILGPSKTIPYILQVYSNVFLTSVFCLIGTIIVTIVTRMDPFKMPPKIICTVLSSNPVRNIFCLPESQTYGMFVDDGLSSEHQESKSSEYWIILAGIIDRIMFSVVTITYTIILTL